jgi:hypothetical protein
MRQVTESARSTLPRLKVVAAGVVLLLCVSMPSAAFKIGFPPGAPPNHEDITADAIREVMPSVDPKLVINIQGGNYNTDLAHQLDARFHFDRSIAGPVSNGGFEVGFNLLHGDPLHGFPGLLQTAVSEASICDASNPSNPCIVNPLFLNPLHTTFRDLVEDIASTYSSLAANLGCLEEPACPTDDFIGGVAYVEAEMALTLVAGDYPDPDDVSWLNPSLVPDFSGQVPR